MFDEPGVTPESPTGTEVQDGSSAGTLNTGTPSVQPSIPYERFKEVNDGYRAAEARAAAAEARAQEFERSQGALTQRMQQLERQLTQRANTPSRTPEEEQQRQIALRTLRDLHADDPDWQRMQQGSRALPTIAQALLQQQERFGQLEQRFAQSFATGQEGQLYQMARGAGLNVSTPEAWNAVNDYVAGIIRSNPEALRRFQNGDPSVLPAAFAVARQQIDATNRAARASLAQTKTQTGQLPPRQGGGAPGTASPRPTFNPSNPDAIEKQVFDQARGFLTERMAQR